MSPWTGAPPAEAPGCNAELPAADLTFHTPRAPANAKGACVRTSKLGPRCCRNPSLEPKAKSWLSFETCLLSRLNLCLGGIKCPGFIACLKILTCHLLGKNRIRKHDFSELTLSKKWSQRTKEFLLVSQCFWFHGVACLVLWVVENRLFQGSPRKES